MGWRDLLQTKDETLVAPWVGGRSLQTFNRTWTIEGRLPREFGWYTFKLGARKATCQGPTEPSPDALQGTQKGYLVGDRFIPEGVGHLEPKLSKLVEQFDRVHLVEVGLDRFVRLSTGRFCENGPLIYRSQEFPAGPEEAVLQAFLDEAKTVDKVPGVAPALDLAFKVESWLRAEVERIRKEEQERREKEERRQKLIEQMGTGAGRRAMAQENFGEGAKAALAVGGAVYLDHRAAPRKGEMVVRFRLDGQRFEVVCNSQTLQILDAGICLTAHYDDPDFAGGTRGDTWFTLESLPGVIQEAQRRNHLVVFRHA